MKTEKQEASSRELRRTMEEDRHQRSFPIAIAILSLVSLFYASTLLLTFHAQIAVRLTAGILNGVGIGMCFVIGHDCCHGCFTPGHWTDRILGRICFAPSLTPYTCWWYGHNFLHHGFTSVRGFDYVWQPLSVEEFESAPTYRRHLERFYRTFFGPALNWLLEIWARHMVFPTKADLKGMKDRARTAQFDRLFVLLFLLGLICFAASGAKLCDNSLSWPVATLSGFVFSVAVPFAVWCCLIGIVIFVHHTHPETVWYRDLDDWSFYRGHIISTTHIMLPFPVNRVFLNIMEHNAHHVDPAIPLYRLVPSQARLEEEYAANGDLTKDVISISLLRRTFQVCCLYDYRNHRWMDFDGNPTTNPAV